MRSSTPTTVMLLAATACQFDAASTTPPPPKDPVEVRASVDRAVVTTGDLITYTVTIDYESTYVVDVPEPGAEIAGLRVVDLGRGTEEINGRIVDTRWYELRADLVGSYIVPAVRIRYGSKDDPPQGDGGTAIMTSEIFIEVASVLRQDSEADDIRDIKPLQPMTKAVPWTLISGAVVALLLIAGVLWRLRKPKVVHDNFPPPPHEEALLALDTLRHTDFNDPNEVRSYFFAISEVIRKYIERRYWLNATDLTTEEILANLPGLGLPGPLDKSLRSFLRDTDMVKFASHNPAPEEIRSIYERALSFVEATVPTPEPESAVKPARMSA